MSDYPATPSYGAHYGTRDPPYLPPTYPNQYLQADDSQQRQMASHYDASMSAYGYNGSIPSFSASAVASGVPPLPIYQGWNQDSIPLPPYTTPHNGTQYTGYAANAQHTAQYYPPPTQPTYEQHIPGAKPLEQGDLSEGEFDDSAMATQTPTNGYGPSQYRESGGTGYIDTAQRAVYSKARDYSPQQPSYPAKTFNYSSRDASQAGRQQSGSYSPYVSPGGADNDERSKPELYNSYAPPHLLEPTNGTQQTQYGWSHNGGDTTNRPNIQANGYQAPSKVDTSSQQVPHAAQPAPQMIPATNGRSAAESRKKAQGAILNLWPYGVRYQTYIDEGFSKEVVGSLFDELKMTRNSAKSTNETAAVGISVESHSNIHVGKENLPSGQLGANSTTGEGNNNGASKDRVTLSSLGTNAPVTNGLAAQTLSTNTMAVAPKPTAMTEKEKTLQSKMEALRKSREERAQKAAAKNVNKPPTTIPAPQVDTPKPPTPKPSISISPPPPTSPSISISQPRSEIDSLASNPPAVDLQHRSSIIPGLFLSSATAGTAPPVSSPGTMPPSNHSNLRKRPVAADFNQAIPSATPYKRPFGHSLGDQRLVINVSDDEADSDDEDVAMDLESQADQDSPMQSARKMSDQRSAAIQSLPPLSNFPTRKPFTPPPKPSATSTPPIQNTPITTMARVERLGHVESEMEKLKKQIAEREARRRAKQASSGARTPQVSENNGSSSNVNIASKVQDSIKLQQMIETVDSKAVLEQQWLAAAQAAESEKVLELKKNEAEQKRIRREKIAADNMRVNAEVQANRSKLEELRAQIAATEAEVQKGEEDKRRLAEEMERIGQEAEEQLQAQKDKLNELDGQDPASSEDSSRPPSAPTSIETSHAPQSDQPAPDVHAAQSFEVAEEVNAGEPQDPTTIGNLVSREESQTQHVNDSTVNVGTEHRASSPVGEPSSERLAESKDQDETSANISNDQALEAALQEAVRAEVGSHADGEEDMDIDDFYAPDSNHLAPEYPSNPVDDGIRSPEYSPQLDRTVLDAPDRESDDYEPPEATPQADELDSPPFSPAPPQIVSSINQDSVDVDMLEVDPTQEANKVEQSHTGEIMPLENGIPPQLIEDPPEVLDKPELFTPYESPLKRFGAYRFHPKFREDVPGGLRSKTYSHKINIMAEFCRYELAGGICNDPTCDLQHFRDIGLPDDAVLTALGSPEEFKGEQRDRFCAGLKGVLMDLRVRKIRDFDIIASEIIAHRAKFLGDKSKVLATLEGTSI